MGDRGGDRLERSFGSRPFGRPKCDEQDDLAALVGDFRDGRRDALDARGVGDLAVLHRHVEIDAHEHALAGQVGRVEGAELWLIAASVA